MSSNRSKLNLDNLKEIGQSQEFYLLLKAVYKQMHSKNRGNPLESVRPSDSRASGTRMLRKLNYLLKNGVLKLVIDEDAMFDRSAKFYAKRWQPFLFPEESRMVENYLRETRRVHFHHRATPELLFQKLNEHLAEALSAGKSNQVLVSQGNTFGEFSRVFNQESKDSKVWKRLSLKGGGPLFLPASGNFASAHLLTANQYEYFYDLSANEIAKSLNSALGRRSLRLAVPAMIPATPDIRKKPLHQLKELKKEYKNDVGYNVVYDEHGFLQPDIKTALFTFGSPLVGQGKLTISKFQKEFDLGLSQDDLADMDEILFRFYRNGILLGTGSKSNTHGVSDLDKRLEILNLAYLGLKESACLKLAREHRAKMDANRPLDGLGSVFVSLEQDKMRSLLLALLKPQEGGKNQADDCFINNVYMLDDCMRKLPDAIRHMPERIQADYRVWREANALKVTASGSGR